MRLFPLMLDALGRGAIRVEYGKITGRCGYVDPTTRTIVLNPDASDEELEAEMYDDLVLLLEQRDGPPVPIPTQRPTFELLPGGGASGDQPDLTQNGRAAST